MRIYDRDYEMSDNQMRVMLDKAALEEHGYKLEIISKLVRDPESESDKPVYQKAYYYYKTVDCSQVPEVNEELDSLIPGVLGSVILTKVRGEIKTRNLDSLKKCQTGLEVHFKEAQGCYGNQKAPIARRTKRRPCGICFVCSSTRVLIGRD